MKFDVFENKTAHTIKRYFIAFKYCGSNTKGIQFYKKENENWKISTATMYFTKDLISAKKSNSEWFKFLGKIDIGSCILPSLNELADKFKE